MIENLTIVAIVISVIIILLLIKMFINNKKLSTAKLVDPTEENLEVVQDAFDVEEPKDEFEEPAQTPQKTKETIQKETIEKQPQVKQEEKKQTPRVASPRKGADRRVSKTNTLPKGVTRDRRVAQRREVPKGFVVTKDDFKTFSGLKILLAEDNIINQKVIQGLLAASGMKIVIANNGQEALDILEKDDQFYIILMDSNMPVLDGIEASKIIRANKRYDHIPIVAHSGDTSSDDIKVMMDAGMEAHLAKPLSMVELYKVLYRYKKDEKKELNIKKGLETCGGSKGFYIEILNEFIASYADSAQKLNTLLLNQQMREADKLLLDLSGITANIGAEILYEKTIQLKNSIHNEEKVQYMTKYKEYEDELENLLRVIKVHL